MKIWPFIKKWFFPKDYFNLIFYGTLFGVWFFHFDSWDRTWRNFGNWVILCVVMMWPLYFLEEVEDEEKRFGKSFAKYLLLIVHNKWLSGLLLIIWIVGIGCVFTKIGRI